jgi:hypothetical protein
VTGVQQSEKLRAAVLVIAGVAAGAGVAHVFVPRVGPGTTSAAAFDPVGSDASPSSDRLAVARAIAAIDDVALLEDALSRAATRPESAARDFEIDALLARLVVLDAERAFRVLGRLELDDAFAARAARVLAGADAGALIDALRSIDDAPRARLAALGALEVLAYDDSWIDRLAATLPSAQGRRLRVDALERRTAGDPYGAFQAALALDASLGGVALNRVGAAWARFDAPAAAGMASRVPRDHRFMYTREILEIWAETDPRAVARYFETADDAMLTELAVLFREEIQAYEDSARIVRARLPYMISRAFDGPN